VKDLNEGPHQLRPDNRYARERGRTLGDLVKTKIAMVVVCRRCKHRRVLYPANLIPRFGEHCPAIDLRERLRCSNCRGRMANLHESSR
jgi:DNA-directed RNA polymerase subunit RPC12/RpoP